MMIIRAIKNVFINSSLSKKVSLFCASLLDSDCSDYATIRELAQLFHYYPMVGDHTIVIGSPFAIGNDLVRYIPEVRKIISEDRYVEVDLKIYELYDDTKYLDNMSDYIFIFRDTGSISVLKTNKKSVINGVQDESITTNKSINYSKDSFHMSENYELFVNSFLNTLVNAIKGRFA